MSNLEDEFTNSVLKTMTNNYEIFNEVNNTLTDIKNIMTTNNFNNPDILKLLNSIDNSLKEINNTNHKIDDMHISMKKYIPILLIVLTFLNILNMVFHV